MKKVKFRTKWIALLLTCILILSGCSGSHGSGNIQINTENEKNEEAEIMKEQPEKSEETSLEELPEKSEETSLEELPEKPEETSLEKLPEKPEETSLEELAEKPELTVISADWSEYFDGMNGAAVVYDASKEQYMIYNSELAGTRRSPCSTFKIISSLIALENGIIKPDDSVHTWSGEVFWNENWNRDIDFDEAFRYSCVWYFREVIDEIGKDIMQDELEKLQYGNCDISDWEGQLNTNNNNRALTGFWIESSLMISPKEQVEVMERIFGENTIYSERARKELKQVMLVTEQKNSDILMYGKTGMGKAEGVVVDAWFTGFAEKTDGNIYYCVYLGRTEDGNVSSSLAKEIAIELVCNSTLF